MVHSLRRTTSHWVSIVRRGGARWWDPIRRRFVVDTRALAAVRIGLGLTLLIDLFHRAFYIELFYSDNGVYPVAAYESSYSHFTGLSIHALSGDVWVQQALFLVAGVIAIAFLVGYRTRLMGAMSLILLFSLHARNPAVLNGGDRLLLVVLFVALVTPLGERWSIDALRRTSTRTRVATVGTAALLVQPLVVFTTNAMKKHAGEHWYAGEGLEIAMHNDVMTIWLGNLMQLFPSVVLMLFNLVWVTLLAGAVIFLFLPIGWLRAVAALVYIGAFAGMGLTLAVGMFPLALAISVIPYLSPVFWDTLAARVAPVRRRIVDRLRGTPLSRPPIERRLYRWIRKRNPATGTAISRTVRTIATLAGIAVLAWILLFAAIDVTESEPPEPLDYDHLDQQRWGLYAPDPSTGYSWYVVAGERSDGTVVDALDGGAVDLDRPPNAASEYETFRHRKFMETVRTSGDGNPGAISQHYAVWACEQADPPVERVALYQLYQGKSVDGALPDPQQLEVIAYICPE